MATLRAGDRAPNFSLTAMDGETLSLSDALKKGPVLAAFFKISCPVCQFTFPFLERMYEQVGGEKVTVWGVSQDNASGSRAFANEFGVKFPVLLDFDGYKTSKQYGLTNVPSIFLIEGSGADAKIQTASVGFAKRDLEAISSQLAAAAGKAAQPLFLPGEKVPEFRPG